MDTNKIEFCNKYAFNIKNNRFKSDILKKIIEKYDIPIIPNKNINFKYDRDMYKLKRFNHYISVLTSGNKYLLYLTKIKNENYCILIDRKLNKNHKYPKMLIINFRFSDELFNETIFECELIKDYNKNWIIIIDSLLLHVHKKNKLNLLDNIAQIYRILNQDYHYDEHIQPCRIYVRKYFVYTELEYIVKTFIKKSNYNIIGLLFNSVPHFKEKIYMYFNKENIPKFADNLNLNFIEIKDSLENANFLENKLLLELKKEKEIIESRKDKSILEDILDIDDLDFIIDDKMFTFLVRKDILPNIYDLYDIKKTQLHKNSIARIDTLECAEFMKEIFHTNKDYLIDCKYNKKFKRWIPEKLSHNKKPCNYYEIKKYIKSYK
jgi:hypothetical protein